MTPGRAVFLLAAASLVAGVAALLGSPPSGVGLRLYLVAAVAAVLAALVSALDRAVPPAPPSVFERALRRRRPPPPFRPAALIELEGLLAHQLTAGDVHSRLRPIVREIAASRLRLATGLDLDTDRDAARQLLGPSVWELVRPDREPPDDRFGPGLGTAELRRVVEALEAVR